MNHWLVIVHMRLMDDVKGLFWGLAVLGWCRAFIMHVLVGIFAGMPAAPLGQCEVPGYVLTSVPMMTVLSRRPRSAVL